MRDGSDAAIQKMLDAILPKETDQQSLLDAACQTGEICFAAERRGVKKVTGIERDQKAIDNCRIRARKRGSKVEFIVVDIERQQIDAQYDWVLFLDRLHRLQNPNAALSQLIDAAREVLVIEIFWLNFGGRIAPALSALIRRMIWSLPIIYLSGAGRKDWGGVVRFFLFERAIQTLLTRHRYSVAKVDFLTLGQPGRSIAIAHKRRIGHLVIVAGVPTSGKSTLITKLLAGKAALLAKKLKIDLTQNCITAGYGDFPRIFEPAAQTMILHYNITTPGVDEDYYGYEGGLLDIIKTAQRLSVVTLWCSADELIARYEKHRMNAKVFGRARQVRRARKHAKLLLLFQEPLRLSELFAGWFTFVRRHCKDPIVYDSRDAGKFMSIEDWEAGSRALRGR
jgi:SAM-dependent methyltransferase